VNKWENMWRTSINGSQTRKFFPTIRDRLAISDLRSNFILTQFLSDHGNFQSYLKRFNISQSDLCVCETSIETPLHVIFECIIYCEGRHQLINAIHRSGHNTPLTPKKLISDKNLFKEFQNFLKNINCT
jgi:hypothetical protein